MTSLNAMKLPEATELNDLKKARMLLRAVIKASPDSKEAWIAAARIEELDHKLPEARQLLQKACEQFPTAEDVWYEAARLQDQKNQSAFFSTALQKIPTSRKLWLLASNQEKDPKSKQKVLKRALEILTNRCRHLESFNLRSLARRGYRAFRKGSANLALRS